MADPAAFQTGPDQLSATTRAVAGDMAAIFGSGSCTVTVMPTAAGRARARPPMLKRSLLVISAGVLAATVAGVYAGRTVPASPVAASAPHSGNAAPRRVERRDVVPPSAPDAVDARPSPFSPPVLPAKPASMSDAPTPGRVAFVAEQLPRRATPVPAPSAAPAPVVRQPPAETSPPPAPAAAAPASAQDLDCVDDDNFCLAPSIGVAEQRVRNAYEQALSSRVRARDMRGYSDEWVRARKLAVAQPRNALRLYAMITSDLLNLADETEARDGAAER